jgi:MFS family permease
MEPLAPTKFRSHAILAKRNRNQWRYALDRRLAETAYFRDAAWSQPQRETLVNEPDSNAFKRDETALDWLNFCLADVKDGLGPFLAIFLLSGEHWDPAQIGIVLTIGGLAMVLARGPTGALVDAITWKRGLIAGAAAAVTAAAIAMGLVPQFWPVAIAQTVSGVSDAIFPVAVAAISLGIFGRVRLTHRIGRNEAFNHAGNVVTACVAGLAGYLFSPVAVLWVVASLALVTCCRCF